MSEAMRSLNEYLFHEFGREQAGGTNRVSDTWPFVLRRIGDLDEAVVFEFDDDEPYFALVGPSLDYMPKAGMTFSDLACQLKGSSWIRRQEPVSLSESKPNDPAVPSGLVRRQHVEALAVATTGPNAKILEGLYLGVSRSYLGLFALPNDQQAFVGGLASRIEVSFPKASPWRRLAWGVGSWLTEEQRGNSAV